jgi:hypothetical protein
VDANVRQLRTIAALVSGESVPARLDPVQREAREGELANAPQEERQPEPEPRPRP